MYKIIILIVSFAISFDISAQFKMNFDDLFMYNVKIDGFINDEQALFFSKLITETDNVLIARFYTDNTGYIYSIKEINKELLDEIILKTKLNSLIVLDFKKETLNL